MGIFSAIGRALSGAARAVGRRIVNRVKSAFSPKNIIEEMVDTDQIDQQQQTQEFQTALDRITEKYDTKNAYYGGDYHQTLLKWDEMPQRIRNLYYMIAEQLGESPDIKFTKKAHEIMINSDLLNYFLDAYEADIPEEMRKAIEEIKNSNDFGLLDNLDDTLSEYQQLRDNIKRVL